MTISDPAMLGPLIMGCVLFGLGGIGFAARGWSQFAILSWGCMILGAVASIYAGGSLRPVSGRDSLVLAAIVVASLEGFLVYLMARRIPPLTAGDLDAKSDRSAPPNE